MEPKNRFSPTNIMWQVFEARLRQFKVALGTPCRKHFDSIGYGRSIRSAADGGTDHTSGFRRLWLTRSCS